MKYIVSLELEVDSDSPENAKALADHNISVMADEDFTSNSINIFSLLTVREK